MLFNPLVCRDPEEPTACLDCPIKCHDQAQTEEPCIPVAEEECIAGQ